MKPQQVQMGSIKETVRSLREDYDKDTLPDDHLPGHPVELFENWLNLAFSKGVPEPIAMNLATADPQGKPSSRIVLLRGFSNDGFVFYTNYQSRKGTELAANPNAALCFYWYDINKQVRIEGSVSKVPAEVSDEYFNSRPVESQIGAWASSQSSEIKSRKDLEDKIAEYTKRFGATVPRPEHWGGYVLKPFRMEFWQGRTSRLHDRIQYILKENVWEHCRLAP